MKGKNIYLFSIGHPEDPEYIPIDSAGLCKLSYVGTAQTRYEDNIRDHLKKELSQRLNKSLEFIDSNIGKGFFIISEQNIDENELRNIFNELIKNYPSQYLNLISPFTTFYLHRVDHLNSLFCHLDES